MNVKQVFPVNFYEFYNSDIVDDCMKLLMQNNLKMTYWQNEIRQTASFHLQKNEEWKFLVDWIESCLNEIKEHEQLRLDGHIKVSSMWGNVSPPKSSGHHTVHRHANSYYSGIFYLTKGSNTLFYDPVYARSLTSLEIPKSTADDIIENEPNPGTMIVFPGYIQHSSSQHLSNNFRVNIAWDSFPHGYIDQSIDGSFKLGVGLL
jgi:hypothetical protein